MRSLRRIRADVRPAPHRNARCRHPTRSEVEKLLDALAMEPRHYRLFYLLSPCTQAAAGASCALCSGRTSPARKMVSCSPSAAPAAFPARASWEGSIKNGKSREVYLSSDLRGILPSPTSAASRWRRTSSAASSALPLHRRARAAHPPGHLHQAGCGRSMPPSAFPQEYHLHTCATTS